MSDGARPPSGRVRRSLPIGIAIGLSGSLLLLFVLPIVALVTYVDPGAPAGSWLAHLASAATSTVALETIAFTLFASGIALGLSLLLGVPLGYLLARRSFPGRSLVESAVALPVVVPHLVAGLALLVLFAPRSPIGALFVAIGLPVFGTVWGVVLVMLYVSAPYTVLASQLSFQGVEPAAIESARTLGATPARAFRDVTLPLATRGIVAGGLLTWARAVSEIGGFLILAYTVYPSGVYQGPVTNPVSVYVYNLYQIGDVAGAVSVASLFVLIAFGLFVTVRTLDRSGRFPWPSRSLLP
ncbi:MAG TPA: ABC transporter permease [Thermoplasmata archaeon]|nr:ABC transporter permease [Thermoplasmata archaeon]HEV2428601.1 ABC transporter permease [Thermoplasmata archaeon]